MVEKHSIQVVFHSINISKLQLNLAPRWRSWRCSNTLLPNLALRSRKLARIKNNRGVEDNRVRHMDYGVQLNKLMYQRLIKGGRDYFI